MLARSYLITLFVIFPIHLNFPIKSSCVLKAIIHRKRNSELLYSCWRKLFFKKQAFYDILNACGNWLIFTFYHSLFLCFMFLYLSFIYYFCHITFYACGSFSKFVRVFPFGTFPLMFKYLEKHIIF